MVMLYLHPHPSPRLPDQRLQAHLYHQSQPTLSRWEPCSARHRRNLLTLINLMWRSVEGTVWKSSQCRDPVPCHWTEGELGKLGEDGWETVARKEEREQWKQNKKERDRVMAGRWKQFEALYQRLHRGKGYMHIKCFFFSQWKQVVSYDIGSSSKNINWCGCHGLLQCCTAMEGH